MDKEFLTAPIKTTVNKFDLIREFLETKGLVKEHLDSYNYLVTKGIKKIVRYNKEIRSSVEPDVFLRFIDVQIGSPSIMLDGIEALLTPQSCRLSDLSYTAPILAHIEYTYGSRDQKDIREKKGVVIGRWHVMLRSCCCVLYEKDEVELAKYGECPLDPGGYFVVKGTEKVFFHLVYL